MKIKSNRRVFNMSNKLPLKSQVFFKFAEGDIGSYKRELPVVQKFYDAIWKDKKQKK